MPVFMLVLALAAVIVHVTRMKERPAKKVLEVVILYLLVIALGGGSLIAGLMHVFNGPATAAMIGWPAGSPFQYELGVADIAFGAVCVLCLFFRGTFWLAAILAQSIFLFGCLVGHIRSMVEAGNFAAYNIGPYIIISDLLLPLALIVLYVVHSRMRE